MQPQASRPAPASQRQVVSRNHDAVFFRGVRFQREVARHTVGQPHRWRMVAPVRGPVFASMKEAAAWCREHGVQHADWKYGFSHDPGHPSWGVNGFN